MDLLSTIPLVALATLLMALKPVLLHLTRSTGEAPVPPEYFQLVVEVLKVVICGSVLLGRRMVGLPAPLWLGLRHTAPYAAPATIFLVMNVLTVRAARLLQPPVFQLVANLKILFTALSSWAFLSRRMATGQWVSLLLLTVGVTLGQWQSGHHDAKAALTAAPSTLGIALMVLNSSLSACGSVFTEKVLKGSASAELSTFATQVHMATHTLLLGGVALCVRPVTLPPLPSRTGVLALALLTDAVNGMLISVLMRRLDSIVKNFCFGASVFVTAGISTAFLDFTPSPQFFAGAALTSLSIVLFTRLAPGPAAVAKGKQQ
mmetsp:Transcript_29139/g.65958  ORF Transcript_29139/g.65958 Transcript_29139/m.65958 type:complete len:318 (+) Transcript_29139:77-1030(+)